MLHKFVFTYPEEIEMPGTITKPAETPSEELVRVMAQIVTKIKTSGKGKKTCDLPGCGVPYDPEVEIHMEVIGRINLFFCTKAHRQEAAKRWDLNIND